MKSLDNSASSMHLLFCELMFAYLWMFILHNVLKPCLFYRLGSVPVYRYMHNFLGQTEFERVPCLTLHGNVPHNHIVHHLVWPAEFLKFSSGQYSKKNLLQTMFQNMWQRESHCSQLPGIEKFKWQNWSNLS